MSAPPFQAAIVSITAMIAILAILTTAVKLPVPPAATLSPAADALLANFLTSADGAPLANPIIFLIIVCNMKILSRMSILFVMDVVPSTALVAATQRPVPEPSKTSVASSRLFSAGFPGTLTDQSLLYVERLLL
jgi:hypothetical protein